MNINALIYNTLFYRKCFKLNKIVTLLLSPHLYSSRTNWHRHIS